MINEKELAKAIKKAAKSRLFWQHVDGFNYMSDGIWMVKTDRLAMFPKVMGALVEIFGKIPADGQTFMSQHGSVTDSGPDCTRIWPNSYDMQEAEPTKLLHMLDDELVRFVKVKEDKTLIAVDLRYYALVGDNTKEIHATNGLVKFDDDLIICPVRPKNVSSWQAQISEALA